jgi:hypothetical protein
MIARRDCQKVLLRRPFTGFAIRTARPANSCNRDAARWAAARDPPRRNQPSRLPLRRHDTGRACRPAQVENQDPSDRSQERNSSWQLTTLHRLSISARGQIPRSPR